MKKILLGLSILSTLAMSAPLQQQNISLEDAQAIAMEVFKEAKLEKVNVSVVILDKAGNLKVPMSGDNSGRHTMDTSEKKAFTALTFGIPTSEFGGRVEKFPALLQIEKTISLPGGVPIKSGNEIIGSIGIGGAPSGATDEKIANAAISKVLNKK